MYLVFDTETTGLPKNYRAPLDDFSNWPRLVQLAWALYDADGHCWEMYDYIIKPDGFVIPKEASDIHRVTQERAEKEGVPLMQVIEHFIKQVKTASFVIAHNIDFDEKIMGSEFLRMKTANPLLLSEKICTMKSSVDFCKIDNGRGSYKWPTLMELHTTLFQVGFEEAHDAAVDIEACAKCFFGLKRKGII